MREEGGREEDVRGGRGKKRGMRGKRTDEQVIKMKVQAEVGVEVEEAKHYEITKEAREGIKKSTSPTRTACKSRIHPFAKTPRPTQTLARASEQNRESSA